MYLLLMNFLEIKLAPLGALDLKYMAEGAMPEIDRIDFAVATGSNNFETPLRAISSGP